MRERACQFGPRASLAGILTEPEGGAPKQALVLVSAGLTPKFGPFRLYAELARRLSASGFRVLRFDLGGIGDSAPAEDGRGVDERTTQQIAAALDFLSEQGAHERIVLAGLCSGADDSFRHAAQDSRVTELVLIDPFAYRTAGFAWRYWSHRARRRLLRAFKLWHPPAPSGGPALVNYEHVPQPAARELMARLLARRVAVHFVYTAGMREHFNHRGQLRAMFRGLELGRRVTLDYLPKLDHTQLLEADRRSLISTIASRLR
ncbi:MAG TPA: alpha/beta fold hydrolase [Polyangiaceae bacterium]|nr:alpha/beta fold hydrolase [Polyangiaceae bacterium]